MIQFNREICTRLEVALLREWLETNGLGGFASSTIIGLNTRRYHGLLIAAIKPPGGRFVLLSKVEETFFIGGQSFELSANQYAGAVHPHGFRYLKKFRLDPFPVFTYEIEGIEIEKSVFMIHNENSTVIQYEVTKDNHPESPQKLHLELRPLIAFRDFHSTTHENSALKTNVEECAGLATITPYPGLPRLNIGHNAIELRKAGYWYRNFEYGVERERGLDFSEDLFNPFALHFDLRREARASMIASTEPREASRVGDYRRSEISRRQELAASSRINDPFAECLTNAADQYVVSRADKKTIIAGYHWFGDWGRDTMIALPGLTLVTGKYDIARSILGTFAQHVDQGMLPNNFPDKGETPEYNTVDATLWFFEAARSYLTYTGDLEFLQNELYPVFVDIISWHVRGTRYGIHVEPSGLLTSGESSVQLTWMDAKVGDWVVTPRRGKPVEIQALWYNALRIMEELAQKFHDEAGRKRYGKMAALASWAFNRLFWNEKASCLYDGVNGDCPDSSIRPNQIFAVSLPYSMLSTERARVVVDKVRELLLTPYGLRSLESNHPQYRGHYTGGPRERDAAYHQGTVWPWLLGPFITAYIRVNGGTDAARNEAEKWLAALRQHLSSAGLSHVSEIFEADFPHRPCGCIAQAWSVGEILRAYTEDVKGIKPSAAAKIRPKKTTTTIHSSLPSTRGRGEKLGSRV